VTLSAFPVLCRPGDGFFAIDSRNIVSATRAAMASIPQFPLIRAAGVWTFDGFNL
jgi:hypothetical protein